MLVRIRKCLVVLLCLAVAACGGGGSGSSSSSAAPAAASSAASSPGVTQGTVTGFGSVIVDGDRISDTSATVEAEGDAGLATRKQSTDVKLGHRVEVERAADGSARRIRLLPELIGMVTAVDAANKSLTVNTNTVTTNTDATSGPVTTFAGFTGFADIDVNDRVEVHGFPVIGAGGGITIQATRIEQKPASAAALVGGTLSELSSGATAFKLGGLSVTVTPGTTVLPAGSSLANGQRVGVLASAGISNGAMTATQIRIRRASSDLTVLRTAGMVTGFTAATSTFTVGGLAVNASGAAVLPASASITNNVYVVVTGNYDPAANSLAATTVAVLRAVTQPPVELHGTITEFVGLSQFKVRGVLIDASTATIRNGMASALANNVAVEVHGNVANNVVNASTVEIQSLADHDVADLVATVQAYDSATRTLSLTMRVGATLQVKLADATAFAPAGKSVADLTAGTAVLVHGVRQGGTFTASTLTVLGQTSVSSAFLAGIVSSPQPASGTPQTFRIEGLTMQVGSATVPDGFAAGARVIVQYSFAGGVYTASAIQSLGN